MARRLRRLTSRAVPVEWERQLAEYSPPNPRFTWLKLIHEPGDPWDEPVDRFIIYQIIPMHVREDNEFLDGIFSQLEGPSPRQSGNYYDSVLQRFVRGSDLDITQRAWELFRELKEQGLPGWGRPWWVIQGTKGGHKRWFSATEKKMLRLNGLPSDPPAPGELPYADFDHRVMAAIARHDTLRKAHGNLGNMRAEAGRADRELEKQWRIELLKWLSDQVADIAPDVHKALMKLDKPRDPNAPDWQEVEEKQTENFVETGRTDGVVVPQ